MQKYKMPVYRQKATHNKHKILWLDVSRTTIYASVPKQNIVTLDDSETGFPVPKLLV